MPKMVVGIDTPRGHDAVLVDAPENTPSYFLVDDDDEEELAERGGPGPSIKPKGIDS